MHDWRDIVCKRLSQAGVDRMADSSLIEELSQHLEDRFLESQTQGASDDEALAAALRELEDHALLAGELAKNRRATQVPPPPVGGPPLSSRFAALWQDLRYAARTLRRSSGFTITAIVTVALSTAPTIGILSVANWLFIQPLPGVSEPHRLVGIIFGVPSEGGGISPRWPAYEHIARLTAASPSIESMAGWHPNELSLVSGLAEPRTVQSEFVSANYFDVLGVQMSAGRSFAPEEDRPPDGTLVGVVSYRLARTLFGDESPIGGRIQVNRHSVTVIGVAPHDVTGSRGLLRTDLWLPGQTTRFIQHVSPENRDADGPFYHFVIRRAPGATSDQVSNDLRNALIALSQDDGDSPLKGVVPGFFAAFGAPPSSFPALFAALIGVGGLLVIVAAANLANLFGFRSIHRAHDTAVRRALGASTGRLLQANMAESIAIATTGCLLGTIVVLIAQKMVGGMMVAGALEIPEVPLDWRLLGMAMLLAFVVAIVMGGAPARLSMRKDLARVIGGTGRFAGKASARFRTGLAVVQMALSLTLLVSALLFVGTLRNLRALDLGFDPEGMTAYELEFRTQGYSSERRSLFYQDLLARLSTTPGVTAVAIGDGTPMFGGEIGMGRNFMSGADGAPGPRVTFSQVSAGYFDALGIMLTSGRSFSAQETFRPGIEENVIVSESLARRLYGTTSAVGRVLTMPATSYEPRRDLLIIGVAEDVRWDDLADSPPLMFYRAIGRTDGVNAVVLVRSADRPERVIAGVRETVRTMDPSLPIRPHIMEDVVSLALAQQRIFAWVLGLIAAIGFLLAAIGIHGLVSQSVIERNREFGIRLAIGADRRRIIALVLRSAFIVVATGAPLGIALAAALAHVLRGLLFGVTPLDPLAYIAAIAALLIVVVAASLAPAWTAARANPSDVLRAE